MILISERKAYWYYRKYYRCSKGNEDWNGTNRQYYFEFDLGEVSRTLSVWFRGTVTDAAINYKENEMDPTIAANGVKLDVIFSQFIKTRLQIFKKFIIWSKSSNTFF